MSHWAEVDLENKVVRVLVGDNNDPNGDEGYKWLIDNLGGVWIKTSYNAATNGFRKNYAGVGFTWDEDNDRFIPPQPYPSWILDEETTQWKAPIKYPNDGNFYTWDEESVNWVIS